MANFPLLETERLKLIEIEQYHSQNLFDILSLDEVTRFYGIDKFTAIEDAANLIESFQKFFKENRAIRWGIVIKDSQTFIGTVGLNNLQRKNKKCEIGYEIHPDYWGNGFTSEAVKEVLMYCFEELDLFRIGAVTYPENTASSNLLKKFSFKEEGLLRGYIYQGNQSHDTFVFSLLKPEWEKSQMAQR